MCSIVGHGAGATPKLAEAGVAVLKRNSESTERRSRNRKRLARE